MKLYNRLPKTLIEDYVFSNVPAYLFDKFKADDFVIDLSRTNTTNELISLFKRVQKRNKKSVQKFVILYAILIAITINNDIESSILLRNLPVNELKWGNEIIKLYDLNRKPTNFFSPTLQLINSIEGYKQSESSENQNQYFFPIFQIPNGT